MKVSKAALIVAIILAVAAIGVIACGLYNILPRTVAYHDDFWSVRYYTTTGNQAVGQAFTVLGSALLVCSCILFNVSAVTAPKYQEFYECGDCENCDCCDEQSEN